MPRKINIYINILKHWCGATIGNVHHIGAFSPFSRTMAVRSPVEWPETSGAATDRSDLLDSKTSRPRGARHLFPAFPLPIDPLQHRTPTDPNLMAIPDPLNELARRLREAGANSPLADIEKNSRALFTNVLGKLDLVTREEFDAQARVLARTREKLEALERRVQEMETAAGAKSPAH